MGKLDEVAEGAGSAGTATMASQSEYLTTAEAAALLRISVKTLRNKVATGILRQGEHFYRRAGLGPRWKRDALVAWLEGRELAAVDQVPLAQGGGRRVA